MLAVRPYAPAPLALLRRRPALPEIDRDVRVDEVEPSRGRLVCRACGHAVTDDRARIEIAGRHVHRRTNPAQVDFEFACFDAATGAASVGPATAEHSWFAGYRWRFAVCGRCGGHLGWFFDGRVPAFWGLITERLTDDQA